MINKNRDTVLFFSYWYPNKFNPIFPVFTRKHAEAIAHQNKVIVLTLSFVKSKGLLKHYAEVNTDTNGLETHRVYIETRFTKLMYVLLPVHYFILKRYIARHLSVNNFTILHSNVLFPCAIVGSRLARHYKLKHVITEHWSRLDSFFKNNLYQAAGLSTYRSAAAITCVSRVLRTTLAKYTQNPKLVVVPNVIDRKEFFLDKQLEKNKVYTFVAAANWTPPKQPFYFTNALQQLKLGGHLVDFELLLIGNGEQLETIKKTNYAYPIRYTGVIDSKQLNTELNRSHLFLHGSDFETFSTIIAEALMCGLPCVVSPVGIATEVIHPGNGFVTDNSAKDWKEKILTCYQTRYDPNVIAEEYKHRYDLESIAGIFSELYAGL